MSEMRLKMASNALHVQQTLCQMLNSHSQFTRKSLLLIFVVTLHQLLLNEIFAIIGYSVCHHHVHYTIINQLEI